MDDHPIDVKEWPYFDLSETLKNKSTSKKVFLGHQVRSSATLEAIRLAVASKGIEESAGFSYICPLLSSVNTYLKNISHRYQDQDTSPDWRYASQELQTAMMQFALFQRSMQTGQTLIPFSFNLTSDFVKKGMQNPKGLREAIKRRLDIQLKLLRSSNDRLQHWYTIEVTPVLGGYTKGFQRPHLHGALLLNAHEATSVRKQITPISKAFHKAIDAPKQSHSLFEAGDHKAHAVENNVSELQAVIGWGSYANKHSAYARQLIGTGNLTADNKTRRQAQYLYDIIHRANHNGMKSTRHRV